MKAAVLIATRHLSQYREAFYDKLRAHLALDGIDLKLVYGDLDSQRELEKDARILPWAEYRPNISIKCGNRQLVYQNILDLACRSDLVIVEQASRLLVNPILLLMQYLGGPRVAIWGHGKNFQNTEGPLATLIKQGQTRHAKWCFAYNNLSAQVMIHFGIPDERITRVMNTIDTSALEADLLSVADDDVEVYKSEMGVHSSNIGVYIGGMYPEKRIPFLLEAAVLIRKQLPDFHLLAVGSGVDDHLLRDFEKLHSWCKLIGPQFGRQKAMALRSGKVLLMPGLVGLVIIDSFLAQVPIVTTDITQHSPEIDYLQSGVNGVIEGYSGGAQAYANTVVSILSNQSYLDELRRGCATSSTLLTIDAMVENFAAGVREALK